MDPHPWKNLYIISLPWFSVRATSSWVAKYWRNWSGCWCCLWQLWPPLQSSTLPTSSACRLAIYLCVIYQQLRGEILETLVGLLMLPLAIPRRQIRRISGQIQENTGYPVIVQYINVQETKVADHLMRYLAVRLAGYPVRYRKLPDVRLIVQ